MVRLTAILQSCLPSFLIVMCDLYFQFLLYSISVIFLERDRDPSKDNSPIHTKFEKAAK